MLVSRRPRPLRAERVGVVGGGQLARMMGEAAAAAGVRLSVLCASGDDAAVGTCDDVLVGSATDDAALRDLADRVDVVTFDHELVDLDQISALESLGVVVRPASLALRFAVDKAFQRSELARAGLPVPRFVVAGAGSPVALEQFLSEVRADVVVKVARGGYDGRGVWFPESHGDAARLVDELGSVVVVEERLDLASEAAQLVVRGADAGLLHYPLVTTVQRDGMCVETRFPADVSDEACRGAAELGERLAVLTGACGVLAVELFATATGWFVNEVALRPHNTGHWTIEGCVTSQFENHLRAVSGRPLGATEPVAGAAVMVNVVGGDAPATPGDAGRVAGVAVHDYGKSWRPGRKLGHVTALGDDVVAAHVRAWRGAVAYGTRTKEA